MSSVYVTEPPTRGKVILKTSFGDVDVELWPKEAPMACRNFVQLCMEGYYDGCVFHRVIKGLLAQTGDPTGTGTGGQSIYGTDFKDEIHTRLKFSHRGQVAMANANTPHTNGSQFFITFDKAPWLDKKHTIFGKVTGNTLFNVLRMGETVDVDADDHPADPVPRIIGAEILDNPFPDIVPRKLAAPTPAAAGGKPAVALSAEERAARIERAKKAGPARMSFATGDEEEEEEEGSAGVGVRGRLSSRSGGVGAAATGGGVVSMHELMHRAANPGAAAAATAAAARDSGTDAVSGHRRSAGDALGGSAADDARRSSGPPDDREARPTDSRRHAAASGRGTDSDDEDDRRPAAKRPRPSDDRDDDERGDRASTSGRRADYHGASAPSATSHGRSGPAAAESEEERLLAQIRAAKKAAAAGTGAASSTAAATADSGSATGGLIASMRSKYKTAASLKAEAGSASAKDRERATMAKLAAFQSTVRSKIAAAPASGGDGTGKASEAYHGQVLEDDDSAAGALARRERAAAGGSSAADDADDDDAGWMTARLKFKKHIDDAFRASAADDGLVTVDPERGDTVAPSSSRAASGGYGGGGGRERASAGDRDRDYRRHDDRDRGHGGGRRFDDRDSDRRDSRGGGGYDSGGRGYAR